MLMAFGQAGIKLKATSIKTYLLHMDPVEVSETKYNSTLVGKVWQKNKYRSGLNGNLIRHIHSMYRNEIKVG